MKNIYLIGDKDKRKMRKSLTKISEAQATQTYIIVLPTELRARI